MQTEQGSNSNYCHPIIALFIHMWNQLANIINFNTIFMNVIDDFPPPEVHYVTFAEWQFKTKGRKWEDQQIVICQTRSTIYVSEPMPLWGVHKVNYD